MARIFLPPEQLTGATTVIDGPAHRHLVKVLRLLPGAGVTVFDGQGIEIEARVIAVAARTAELALGQRRAIAPPRVAITLVQAVPRGERLDLVVQKTTELGVMRIVPVLAGRSIPRPGPQRLARWRTIAREAARQSGRADVPTIDPPLPLAALLANAASLAARRFVLWEGARDAAHEGKARPLRRALQEIPGMQSHTAPDHDRGLAVALLVGPEGGFSDLEIAAAAAAGFEPVGLGPRILRTETAAITAVALVQAAAGGLD